MIWPLGRPPDRPVARHGPPIAAVILPHLDAAYNLARWLVRDASQAEDVVQDAVERALRYAASFEARDARAWWMRIVRNAAYDALAARKQDRAAVDDGAAPGEAAGDRIADPADDPERALLRRQDRATLMAALDALPVALRECLMLREIEELSYKDIAAMTGVPIGTVMSRLSRARRALMETAPKGPLP